MCDLWLVTDILLSSDRKITVLMSYIIHTGCLTSVCALTILITVSSESLKYNDYSFTNLVIFLSSSFSQIPTYLWGYTSVTQSVSRMLT